MRLQLREFVITAHHLATLAALSDNWEKARASANILAGAAAFGAVCVAWWVFVKGGPRLEVRSGIDDNHRISIVVTNRGRMAAHVTVVGLATRKKRHRRHWLFLRRPQEPLDLAYPKPFEQESPPLWQVYRDPKELHAKGGILQVQFYWPENRTVLAERQLFKLWPSRSKVHRLAVDGPDRENIRGFVRHVDGYKYFRIRDMRSETFEPLEGEPEAAPSNPQPEAAPQDAQPDDAPPGAAARRGKSPTEEPGACACRDAETQEQNSPKSVDPGSRPETQGTSGQASSTECHATE